MRGIRPEDLQPAQGPLLVHTDVPHDDYVDAVSERGLAALGLPTTYPHDASGREVPHRLCQPIGLRAWQAGERGIACRSAARTAPRAGEELAYFARKRLRPGKVEEFADWYW